MAENGKLNGYVSTGKGVSEKTADNFLHDFALAQKAVRETQEENRRLGIPNWWMINGKIVSDQQIDELEDAREKRSEK